MANHKALPTKLKSKDKAVFKLVSSYGVSKNHCIRSLKLPINYFHNYIGTKDNYDQAMTKFTELLMKATMNNIEFSDSNRKYLMQRLRVHDFEIKLPKVVDAKSAQQALGLCIEAYARKELTDTQLVAMKTAVECYSSLSVHTDLQEKVERLEALFTAEGKK